MRPYTERGKYISRVLLLRDVRERVTVRRGPHAVVLVASDGSTARGGVSVLSTWGLVAKVEAVGLRDRQLRAVFGPEWRIILDPETDPREGRGTITAVEAIPVGFRIEIRLKSPLRPVTTGIQARPEA